MAGLEKSKGETKTIAGFFFIYKRNLLRFHKTDKKVEMMRDFQLIFSVIDYSFFLVCIYLFYLFLWCVCVCE